MWTQCQRSHCHGHQVRRVIVIGYPISVYRTMTTRTGLLNFEVLSLTLPELSGNIKYLNVFTFPLVKAIQLCVDYADRGMSNIEIKYLCEITKIVKLV